MKKHVAVVGLIMVFLVVFIPFASSSPDGLQTVANALGLQAREPFWAGLMAGYKVTAIGDSYFSTFLAGSLGTLMVLAVSFLLGNAMKPKNDGR